MHRRVACALLAGSGALAIALGSGAIARPHIRHATGTLSISVKDPTGAPIPARLTFRPVDGTPKVFFTTTDIGREEVGAVSAFDRAFVLRGDAEIRVPTGTYDVWVSHGIEWDTARERVTIRKGEETELTTHLRHVIDTPGYISGDFHVHAAPSLDSRVPLRDRVFQFVADGVDLIVATDHNIIADYAPVIAELGVSDLLASSTGDEITTKSWGHFGAFPLKFDEAAAGHGAIDTVGHTPAQIFADVRKQPAALVDIHHPRLEHGKIGYFHLAAFDAKTGAAKAGFSYDFDAVEVLNGYQDADRKSVGKVLADWIALLDGGKRCAATGNSDSHHMTFNLGGYPRNYVAVGDVPLAKLDAAKVAAAVKAGHSYFTTGPILEANIDGRSFGELATVRTGTAKLHVIVRAANWISTSKLTVIGPTGATLASVAIPASTDVVRLDTMIDIPVTRDGYAIVRVDGDRPMAPNVGDQGVFLVYPLAIANPIWIDADGDGAIAPRAPLPSAPVTAPVETDEPGVPELREPSSRP